LLVIGREERREGRKKGRRRKEGREGKNPPS
jgi:hypothetical protein